MNEHEIKDAFRDVMVASSPPPPMPAEVALEEARRVHRRRRTTVAGTGAVLAVVAIAIATVVAPGLPNLRPDQLGLGDPPGKPAQPAPSGLTVTADVPPGAETKPVWPTGPDGVPQSDRTAYAGPRHDQGVRLLDRLIAVVPAGFEVPAPEPNAGAQATDPEAVAAGQLARQHEAQFEERVDGVEVWQYMASVSIRQGGGTGLLAAVVYTPRNNLPAEPCDAAMTLWGSYGPDGQKDLGWQCQVMDVGGRQVGVISSHLGDHPPFDQWAFHRHDDGTVVFVAQSMDLDGSGLPALSGQPFTLQRLAELAADPQFRLG